MTEQELLRKLKTVKTMPELDELRPETARLMGCGGFIEPATFERVQGAFRKAKNRLRRIPLSQRTW